MPIFSCKLGGTDGRVIEREMEAANAAILRQTLEDQGFFVFAVNKRPFQFLLDRGRIGRKVDSRELLTFNQELLVLIKAGLPIIQSLDTILEQGGRGNLVEVLRQVREDVKGGAALSDAFSRFPKAFPTLYIASIRAGERTGDLPQTIRRYIAFLKRVEGLRKKVIAALVYPSILVTVAVLAVGFLLIYVVPTFSKIYLDSGSALPLPTQILITLTTGLKSFFPLLLLGAMALVVGFRKWVATETGRFAFDTFLLKIPLIGQTLARYAVSGFCRTLATVIGSGVPIVEGLRMSVGTLNNRLLERKVLGAISRIEEGALLSASLADIGMMPPLALRMIAVGETTGALEEMLNDVSEYFEEDIDARLHVLTTAIEPIIMIFMGLVVGGIILTMYLPIFNIAGTVGG
jgi:type IV pilus assembly protein PilC